MSIYAGADSRRAPTDTKTIATSAPEDILFAWLLALPGHADVRVAAKQEINRLRGYRGSHPGPARLLELFEGLLEATPDSAPRPN